MTVLAGEGGVAKSALALTLTLTLTLALGLAALPDHELQGRWSGVLG